MAKAITTAALATGEKIYNQLSEQTAAHLDAMEARILARVIELLEERLGPA